MMGGKLTATTDQKSKDQSANTKAGRLERLNLSRGEARRSNSQGISKRRYSFPFLPGEVSPLLGALLLCSVYVSSNEITKL